MTGYLKACFIAQKKDVFADFVAETPSILIFPAPRLFWVCLEIKAAGPGPSNAKQGGANPGMGKGPCYLQDGLAALPAHPTGVL